jgi:CheY-like chemotaxis protein
MPTRVLIVDDHPSFLASASALLESEGYLVVGTAAGGYAALAAVDTLGPDLVLVDVHLPALDGFEVTRRLVGRSRPPVVVLTSSRDAADFGARVAASGAAGFVGKAELCRSALQAVLEAAARP